MTQDTAPIAPDPSEPIPQTPPPLGAVPPEPIPAAGAAPPPIGTAAPTLNYRAPDGGYAGPAPTPDEKNMGMLSHLLGLFSSFIGPLIIWMMKKDQSPWVEDQAKEALNFQIIAPAGDDRVLPWFLHRAAVDRRSADYPDRLLDHRNGEGQQRGRVPISVAVSAGEMTLSLMDLE